MSNGIPPALDKALQSISSSINPSTSLGHPSDMQNSVRWLSEAIQVMDSATHPDSVVAHLVGMGRIGETTARDVAMVYEALWCHIKGQSPFSSHPIPIVIPDYVPNQIKQIQPKP